MLFKDQTVIVTGGANGIGKEIACTFAREGANVVIADVDRENGRRLEQFINSNGWNSCFFEADVKKETDITELIRFTIEKFKKINVLVNNAGISRFKSMFELSMAEWDEVIQTNLTSVFLCSREAAKYMKETSNGSIINISSTRAFMSEAHSESYAATKGGIIALTHALAASLSEYRIRVNSISPGWIHTGGKEELSTADHNQHWSKRVGQPNDIARTCLFLASSESDFINGENITVDGGMTRKMIYA